MPENDKTDDAYGVALERMNDRIHHAILNEDSAACVFISYSAYETDDDGIPIDNLDETAVHGTVRFYQRHNPFWDVNGEGADYLSSEVTNPTWLQVAKLANEMINITGDEHHVFLEGISGKGPTRVFEMGS